MKLFHVVAIANNRVIGKDNKLPWHFPADLKFFKQLTTGHTVIMGRKTFESIGKPLPNRENIVISRSGLSLEGALQQAKGEKVFIIGGAQLFEQTLNQIDGIYLTRIHADYEGDTFYPELPKNFVEKSRTPLQENPKIEVIYYEKS